MMPSVFFIAVLLVRVTVFRMPVRGIRLRGFPWTSIDVEELPNLFLAVVQVLLVETNVETASKYTPEAVHDKYEDCGDDEEGYPDDQINNENDAGNEVMNNRFYALYTDASRSVAIRRWRRHLRSGRGVRL